MKGEGMDKVCEALARIVNTYDAYRQRGVSPAPAEYADLVAAINAAREALSVQPAEPVAYGYPNSAITGRNRWMMLRESIPEDDQYGGAMWVPLFAAPQPAPSVPAVIGWRDGAYRDSTPLLHVGDSAFEDWFQAQPFATQTGIKQMCRDSYAAGMGDPLVTYAAAPHPAAKGGAT